MTDKVPQNNNINDSLLENAKDLSAALKDRKYFRVFKELFVLFKTIYKNYLKGRYVSVSGKKVPMTAVLVIVLGLVYAVFPSDSSNEQANPEDNIKDEPASELKEKEDLNTYNQDGIKVYGLYKCEKAVCGFIENDSDNDVARILVSLTFHDKSGAVVYEGGAEATAMTAKSRSRFKIPTDGEFDYFRLTDVTIEK